MYKQFVKYLLIIFLIGDICYSLVQHYHMHLDGDMASVVLPMDGYKHMLGDPFGISALKGEHYLATNRYFAHETMLIYFNTAPFICQLVVDPVDSLYLSSAIAKLGIQILIIWLLSVYISRSWNIYRKEFLISAILVTPLFQIEGFYSYLGIIDKSITYTFFYALPLGLLMLFFLPFYIKITSKQTIRFNPIVIVLLVSLAIIISFNGPLNPATVIIICPLFLVYKWWEIYGKSTQVSFFNKATNAIRSIPKTILFFFITISLLCLYSLYIGSYNSAFVDKTIPLLDRYLLLPKGLFFQFTKSIGPALLLLVIGINCYILYKQRHLDEAKSLLNRLKWIGIFSVIYILLLPIGGYREYRPFIIRYDTFMPINLCLFYFYGISTLYVINHYSSKYKRAYLGLVISFLLIFTLVDKTKYDACTCEKESLKTISQSKEKIVLIENDCWIMFWGKVTDYNDSKLNTQYLKNIGVLKEEKYYYQK